MEESDGVAEVVNDPLAVWVAEDYLAEVESSHLSLIVLKYCDAIFLNYGGVLSSEDELSSQKQVNDGCQRLFR